MTRQRAAQPASSFGVSVGVGRGVAASQSQSSADVKQPKQLASPAINVPVKGAHMSVADAFMQQHRSNRRS